LKLPSFKEITITKIASDLFWWDFLLKNAGEITIFPWFFYGFPMVFLGFSYGLTRVFLGFSDGFPRVLRWFSDGFPRGKSPSSTCESQELACDMAELQPTVSWQGRSSSTWPRGRFFPRKKPGKP
jgi:hypothetical protein